MSWRDFSKHIRHLSPTDRKTVEEAFLLGEQYHRGQLRESGLPFFSHPVAVAQYLALLNADAETLIAALLHDTVEDTALTLEEVHARFGERVSTMIQGLTKLAETELSHQPTMDEKIETLRRMFGVMEKDVRVITIKLADRLHNMQTIGFRPPDKQRAVAKETLDLYVKIADRLCMRDLRDELSMLCHGVLEPELHDTLLMVRERNRKRFSSIAPSLRAQLEVRTPGLKLDIAFEPKSWENLHIQYELEKETSHHPSLLLNASFLCESAEECYRMLGAIHLTWPRIVLTFDDFINVPAINGYRGLQTTVILPDGTHLRCKIRTYGMDAYSRRGIATVCFETHARGVLEYLPWTRHIGPLASDTRDRSTAFWETLQSDILSESFVIYGNENRSVLVPTNATALDGALYLYPESALRLTALYVNGKKVSPTHALTRADVLEIDVDRTLRVQREWLHWTHSGIGSALIRSALAKEKQSVKITTGKQLLQEYLLAHQRGYISELSDQSISSALEEQGIAGDMDTLYTHIAEGRILPETVERVLYPPSSEREKRTSLWLLHCKFLFQQWPGVHALLLEHDVLRLRFKRHLPTQTITVRALGKLTSEQAIHLEQKLHRIDVQSMDLRSVSFSTRLLTTLIILLWGLNPVFAAMLLRSGMTPLTLVSIRTMTFGICATIVYVVWRHASGERYVKIPFLQLLRLSFTPTLLTIALAAFTYEALASLPPSLHLTILRINIVLLPLLHAFSRSTGMRVFAVTAAALAATGIIFLFDIRPITIGWGTLFSVLALCTYVLYSTCVECTLQEHRIGLRHHSLFFASGILMSIAGLGLTPFIKWGALLPMHIALASLYVVVCVFLPHAFMYMLSNRRQVEALSSRSILENPIAVVGEIALLGILLAPWQYFVMTAVLVGTYLLFHMQSHRKPA